MLQGKLDKQKEQNKSLEGSLKARPRPQDHMGVFTEGGASLKAVEGASAMDKASLIDSKVY